MIDPVALEKAAIALANQTVMRNGSPPISNVLDLMSAQTRSSFTGDATACIEAYLEAAKPTAARLALHPTAAQNFLDAQAHKWAEEVHLLTMAEAITDKPDRLDRIIALARQSFVEGAYRAACELSPAAP